MVRFSRQAGITDGDMLRGGAAGVCCAVAALIAPWATRDVAQG